MVYIKGTPASPGLTLGVVKHLSRSYTGLNRVVLDPRREQALFEAAVILARDELQALCEKADAADRDILTFQYVLLEDVGLIDEISSYIAAGAGGAAAVERAADIFVAKIRSIDDSYLRERASDILDTCRRVVDILDGRPREQLLLQSPAIVVADEIFPSDIVSVDRGMILGFVTSNGSAQGHAAIIARTMGIPAIVMAGEELLQDCDGMQGALDGIHGEFYLEPDEAIKARFSHSLHVAARRSVILDKLKTVPCITKGGVKVNLYANCASPEDIEEAIDAGAEGIGLLRSEFILMSGRVPSEEEQYWYYVSCLAAADGRPLTIRTFDIGADKEVEGLTMQSEPNPALGLRGLRFSLARKDIFAAQIAALLRAGCKGDLRVMFPMVTTYEDLTLALEIVDGVKDSLRARGVVFNADMPFGIMIETPAAALMAQELAEQSAFFSIGTNDLAQYTHAVDRVNPLVEKYFPTSSAAVRKLMRMTVASAQIAGIPVCVCGESAADPDRAADYVRYGIHTLSMSSRSILEVKESLLEME
ncbi:MAG: phosphoenolpyruvate--protein phosphotransferase [Oscillospiraceae bacterium]